ncbi:hypothetical protein [Streptomyces shenzhenensis]|uniref:hypothetical protein n=1 Tax=Streptomyces shenzhenensis TaxID=943815 RepID=UPI0015F11338|nr:hypothetical protein [Streptomyces shenzhenensis]
MDTDLPLVAEVRVVWGEPDSGTRKVTVTSHEVVAVRATVGPVPYVAVVRAQYRPGRRAANARLAAATGSPSA